MSGELTTIRLRAAMRVLDHSETLAPFESQQRSRAEMLERAMRDVLLLAVESTGEREWFSRALDSGNDAAWRKAISAAPERA